MNTEPQALPELPICPEPLDINRSTGALICYDSEVLMDYALAYGRQCFEAGRSSLTAQPVAWQKRRVGSYWVEISEKRYEKVIANPEEGYEVRALYSHPAPDTQSVEPQETPSLAGSSITNVEWTNKGVRIELLGPAIPQAQEPASEAPVVLPELTTEQKARCGVICANAAPSMFAAAMLAMREGLADRQSRATHPAPSTREAERLRLYDELILAVGNKYPGESRHETALRYIRRAEQSSGPAGAAAALDTKEGS